MSGYCLYAPKPQFLDANGVPLANGTLEVYLSGTSELATIYTDADLSVTGTNPIDLNARGEPATPIYLAYNVEYKLILKDELGATVYTADPYLLENTPASLVLAGNGSPEGAVAAAVGRIYLRYDGGASTTLYVKESGTGNTGWVAK